MEAAEFERQLRANGHAYHNYHPFNVLLNSGGASARQIRGWVANRFYYHTNVPLKDAATLANGTAPQALRDFGDPWVRLGEAVGLRAEELWSTQHVLPSVRSAVNDYARLAQRQPWQESLCASLTELFAATVHGERLAAWSTLYPWIEPAGLEYFRTRVGPRSEDLPHGLRITLEYFRTREAQCRALELLRVKLDLLWGMLDSVQLAYSAQDG